jgi:hypothetical protein
MSNVINLDEIAVGSFMRANPSLLDDAGLAERFIQHFDRIYGGGSGLMNELEASLQAARKE